MILKIWDGSQLVVIEPPDLPTFARQGIYICCLATTAQHTHNDQQASPCGYHLWIYVAQGVVPPQQILMHKIHTEVPHVNGNGVHQF
jgi:hypothetical protein